MKEADPTESYSCVPPHTIHRLKVADVAFIRPLNLYYDQAFTTWLHTNPGMLVTMRQVAELFGKAFIQAATMSTVVNCFKKKLESGHMSPLVFQTATLLPL
ncbi:hypothetical protein GWI33_013595 [Rhynchophorus ferrugineus]|uniref:Uncharacterized protein n=1 Tax=Rhynchophorus ferrugineus TaxID=354439 RepID=A0A834I3G0_RHYFE|nr:hypothetical protein GWI33_013595 [Rhynchophorus ferrugineus]